MRIEILEKEVCYVTGPKEPTSEAERILLCPIMCPKAARRGTRHTARVV